MSKTRRNKNQFPDKDGKKTGSRPASEQQPAQEWEDEDEEEADEDDEDDEDEDWEPEWPDEEDDELRASDWGDDPMLDR
jgi:hypothetical protein